MAPSSRCPSLQQGLVLPRVLWAGQLPPSPLSLNSLTLQRDLSYHLLGRIGTWLMMQRATRTGSDTQPGVCTCRLLPVTCPPPDQGLGAGAGDKPWTESGGRAVGVYSSSPVTHLAQCLSVKWAGLGPHSASPFGVSI